MQNNHTPENVFGKIAELYDEVRPEYPPQLVADVIEWSRLPADGRLLEIGCGTGKATRVFAPYGYEMTCVDPAGGMLEVARTTCTDYPKIEFIESKFEEWAIPENSFDLVFSAQAFHWIEPTRGLAQVAQALRTGSAFSLFWQVQEHPDESLREAIDDAYRRIAPKMRGPAPGEKNTKQWPEVVQSSGHFAEVETGQYEWQIEYDADTWVRLLQTHSDHRILEPAQRDELLSTIHNAIEAHGGILRLNMTTELVLTRKT